MMNHTSSSQDCDIDNATSRAGELVSHAEVTAQHIADLVSIIEELDAELDKKNQEIETLERRIVELES